MKSLKEMMIVVLFTSLCALMLLLGAGQTLGATSYQQAIDTLVAQGYPAGFAADLNDFGTSSVLGFRFAGSSSDNDAASFIAAQMRTAGLVNVRLEAVPVDVSEFIGASVTVGDRVMQATTFGGVPATPGSGLTGEIVYVGGGWAADYANVGDVGGKLVLVDFTGDWSWSNLPAHEATLRGAKGVIFTAPASPAYGSTHPDTLISFDGSYDLSFVPMVYVSQQDGDWLKGQLEAGTVTGTMNNDTPITLATEGGQGYNVIGELPGTPSMVSEIVVLSSHHDAFFRPGFDDTSAVATMLLMAKAMKMSGYRPARKIVFLVTTGEEYGRTNSYYNWLIGAWHAVSKRHPGWPGRVAAQINLESQGMPEGRMVIRTVPELKQWVQDLADSRTDLLPYSYRMRAVEPWNDQWAFAVMGIPTIYFSTKTSIFDSTIYHTQYDVKELVDWDYVGKNAKLYFEVINSLNGGVLPFALTDRATEIASKVDGERLIQAGVDSNLVSELIDSLTAFQEAADRYDRSSASIAAENVSGTNKWLLAIEKILIGSFTALDCYDAPVYPHEQVLADIEWLNQALDALNQGSPDAAIGSLYWVGITWYGAGFSYPVYQKELSRHAPDYSLLFWVVRSHLAPYVDVIPELRMIESGDLASAAAGLQAKRDAELDELKTRVQAMTKVLKKATFATRTLLAW